jgi:hypothetical protein
MCAGLEAPASQERTEMTTRNVAVVVGSIRTVEKPGGKPPQPPVEGTLPMVRSI